MCMPDVDKQQPHDLASVILMPKDMFKYYAFPYAYAVSAAGHSSSNIYHQA